MSVASRAIFSNFFWRTEHSKPPTIPFGIVACTFSDNPSRNSCIQNSVLYVQRCCFAYQTTFSILFYFLSFFLSLVIYLSFFFFDVLGCGRSHRYYSSLSGTLQNNKDDGNGNIKTIDNTQTVSKKSCNCWPSQQWRMKYLLHPFSSSPLGLQSTSPSQRQLRGIQRLPHENSSAEQLILSKK